MNAPPNRIKELREAKGWTQADVAHVMGVDPATVSGHETGRRGFDTTMVTRYATLFGLTYPLELFNRVDPETGEVQKP